MLNNFNMKWFRDDQYKDIQETVNKQKMIKEYFVRD